MAGPIDAKQPLPATALPGGHYSWVDNGDGTFNILDVPVLAELPAGAFPHPVNKEPIDRAWMEKAIAKAKQRESEGHIGAVHVHHHGSGAEVVEAGRLLLDHVGRAVYDGKERDVLFAHLLRIPQDVFDQIKCGKLPYRSIEGEPWDKREVVSLAIMPTETPYFRLPMLTLGEQIKPSYLSLAIDKRYAVAASASGFSNQPAVGGSPMPDDKVVAEVPKPLPAQQQNPQAPVNQEPAKAQQDPAKQEQKPGDAPPKKSGGGVTEKMKGLFAMMMALVMQAIGESEDENDMASRKANKAPSEQEENPKMAATPAVVAAPAPEKPVEDVKAAMEVPPKPELPIPPPVKAEATVTLTAGPTADVKLPEDLVALQKQNAELAAKVAALEGKVQAQVVVDQVALDLEAAEKALKGYNVTPSIKAAMAEQRKVGGKACLDAFVAVFAQAALKDPPATLEAATTPSSAAAGTAPSGDDEILNKLGPQSPETMKRAHELIACSAEYCKAVRGTTPFEYVKFALKSEGLLRA
jgi:hypothetical protein